MAPGSLSADLTRVLDLAEGRSLPISRIIEHLEERGHALVLLLLTIPFVLPFPTLGMSAPIGIALAMIGLGVAAGRPPVLPGFLRRREIGYEALCTLVRGAAPATSAASALLRPRLGFMVGPGMRALLGLSLAASAVVLALPLPLPLANFFPAVAILFLAAGLMERDGLFVMAGHVATVLVCVLLYASFGTAWLATQRILAFVA